MRSGTAHSGSPIASLIGWRERGSERGEREDIEREAGRARRLEEGVVPFPAVDRSTLRKASTRTQTAKGLVRRHQRTNATSECDVASRYGRKAADGA